MTTGQIGSHLVISSVSPVTAVREAFVVHVASYLSLGPCSASVVVTPSTTL